MTDPLEHPQNTRLARLESLVLVLAESVDRLAAAIARDERWPLDPMESIDGATPGEWPDVRYLDDVEEIRIEHEQRAAPRKVPPDDTQPLG